MHPKFTSRGRVTLPRALRERLRLAADDRAEFVLEDVDTVRLRVKRDSATRLKGLLPRPDDSVSLEAMGEAIRRGARGL